MIENAPDIYPERHFSLDEIEEVLTKNYIPVSEPSYLKIINQGQDLNIDFDNV